MQKQSRPEVILIPTRTRPFLAVYSNPIPVGSQHPGSDIATLAAIEKPNEPAFVAVSFLHLWTSGSILDRPEVSTRSIRDSALDRHDYRRSRMRIHMSGVAAMLLHVELSTSVTRSIHPLEKLFSVPRRICPPCVARVSSLSKMTVSR